MGVLTKILYIDYANAFGVVCHEKVLFKLEKYGVGDSFLKWLRAFLRGEVFK